MKWIAARQRVEKRESFERGRLWASGYVVAKNRIDIEDAFICIPLPCHQFDYCPWNDDWRWCQISIMYVRSRGWFTRQDFDVEQYT